MKACCRVSLVFCLLLAGCGITIHSLGHAHRGQYKSNVELNLLQFRVERSAQVAWTNEGTAGPPAR